MSDYNIRLRKNIQKIKKKISKLDLATANSDDYEKLADYYDEIKIISNKAIVKLDELIDCNSDSSDELDSLSDLSINDSESLSND